MKTYISKNGLPLMWEFLFVGSCFWVPGRYVIYTNFIFYLGITVYFLLKKDISFRQWGESLRSGGAFWKAVGLTIAGFAVAFGAAMTLEMLFPEFPTGTIGLRRDTWGTLLLFAVSTILLPPLAEESFYRGSLIVTDSGKAVLTGTALLSMFLYALEHAVALFGIVTAMLLAIPMSVAYIKTKNLYVVMTAHFIANLLGNGADVIITAINWLK